MKPYLLYRENDPQVAMPVNEPDLVKDLNLRLLYDAMAHGDDYLRSVAARVVPRSLRDPELIKYRQEILAECFAQQYTANKLYTITSEAAADAASYRGFTRPSYAQVVSSAVRLRTAAGLLEMQLGKLRELANVAQENTVLKSPGLYGFCMRVNEGLNTGFFAEAGAFVRELKNAAELSGMVIGGRVGQGLKGTGYSLRKLQGGSSGSLLRKRYKINLKDYLLASCAKEAEEAGFTQLLRIVNHFSTVISTFMDAVRFEIGFYVGCVNLYRLMQSHDLPFCIPEVRSGEDGSCSFENLYDLSIALADNINPVANTLELNSKRLIFVTGANQGGKSTFLRSAGIMAVMAQAGMQVAASSAVFSATAGIYTHFARAEDAGMEHGKLDEELDRMRRIIDLAEPHSLILMNEAFATTTEREGALIGSGILAALYELDIRVIYVTHLYELADTFFAKGLEHGQYLIAQRLNDGSRSFHVLIGRPRETSYGEDLYEKIIVRHELTLAPEPAAPEEENDEEA